MTIVDRREEMELVELLEELELAHPDEVAGFEARHGAAIDAVANGDPESCAAEELEDLHDDLVRRLRV